MGLSEDLTVLVYVINKIWVDVPEDVKQKAHDKLSEWFDEDELTEVEDFLNEHRKKEAQEAGEAEV